MMRRLLFLLLLGLLAHPILAQTQPDYFLEAEVSNASPYVGQQIRYSFRLYSRVLGTNSGLFLEPSYDGFWLEEINTLRYQVLRGNRSYEVRAHSVALFPTRPGPLTIEPVQFVIPDTPIKAGEVLVSDAVTINVQPLPEAGRADNFSGAVGDFELLPTIDRQTTRLGEPISLQLAVRGDGNVAQIPIPALPDSTDWRSYANPSQYQSETSDDGPLIGQTTFSWLLTPLKAGDLALPEISLSYFDPAAASYKTISTSPVTIQVAPGEGEADSVSPPEALAVLPLRPIPASLTLGKSVIPGWSWLLWLIAPLATLAIWLRARHLEHRRRYAAFYRRSEALKQAQGALAQAQKKPASAAYRLIWDAIMNYFGDKLDQSAAMLDYEDLEAAMQAHGVQPEIAVHVLNSLQRLDQARYAPFGSQDARSMTDQVSKILNSCGYGLAMRRLLLIAFVLAVLNPGVQGQDELHNLAEQAQAAYASGDFAAASSSYESLVAQGVQDSTVYINLGHSYFEQHDYGRALLNYRRAQELAPRDLDLSADLARVRSLRIDVQGDETALVDSLALLTSAALTETELTWLVLGLWTSSFGLLYLYILKSRWRAVLRGPLLVLALLMVLGLILWGSRSYSSRFRPAAVVIPATVSIMSGPGEDYLELYTLHAAAEMRVLQVHDDWARFILPDQRQGWIPLSAVESV